jgi:TonB family protein
MEKKTTFLHQPEYPGGTKALTAFIYKNLKYPPAAFEAGIEGIVYLEYDIDNKGRVIETRVLQKLGHGCDEEAQRVVSLLKFDVPRNRGVRVIFHKKIQVHFKKPVAPAAPTPNAPTFNYTITPSAPAESPETKPEGGVVYTYTINL